MKQVFRTVPADSSNRGRSPLIRRRTDVDMRKIVSLLMLALVASPSFAMAVGAESLTVQTDRAFYNPGESVEIFGVAEANASVAITVNDTLGIILNITASAGADGGYSATVNLTADALKGRYTVTAEADDETAQACFVVLPTSLQEHAENLLSLVERSRERVEEAIEELESEGIEVPDDAEESIELGFTALEEALRLLGDGDYSEAIEKGHEALQHFGNALRILREALPDEAPASVRAQTEKAQGLRNAIDRAYAFVDKVNATAERLEEAGYAVPDIEANLTDAKAHLEAAAELVDEDIAAAARELAAANGILGRTMGMLHSEAVRTYKAWKAERFLEQVDMRIDGLEEKIESIQSRLSRGQAALSALRATKTKLLRIRERLTAGNVEDAVDDLDDAVQEIDEELEDLDGPHISKYLRAMDMLEAKVRVLNATTERLAARGVNASEIEEQLQSARALLSGMRTQLEEGDLDEAGDLLREAREQLQETRKVNRYKIQATIAATVKKWVQRAKAWSP